MGEQIPESKILKTEDLATRHTTYMQEFTQNRFPSYGIESKKIVGRGKGTFVERDLFESDAFLSLRGVASQMLIYLLGKREFKRTGRNSNQRECLNCKELTLSYQELKSLGITQPRATRGFDELLAKGFIEIKHVGGAYQKDKSVYALSDKWRLWRGGTVFFKRQTHIKRGFQGQNKG